MQRRSAWLLPLATAAVALTASGCGGTRASAWRVLFLSDRDGAWSLYTMDATGGDQRRLFSAGRATPNAEAEGIGEPLLSPDGRSVLLSQRGITLGTLASGRTKRLTSGEASSATWSPDSNEIAFAGATFRGMYVFDLRDGTRHRLLRRDYASPQAWSPDGEWIVVDRQIGYGPDRLWAVHPDGSGMHQLTAYLPDGDFYWSSASSVMYLGSRGSSATARLVHVDVDTAKVQRVGKAHPNATAAAWSPDGRTLAYTATNRDSDRSTIFAIGRDGSDPKRLTPPAYWDDAPAWSHDGKSLLFVRTPLKGGLARHTSEIWTMRADGRQAHPLTYAFPDGGSNNVEPTWIRGSVHVASPPRAHELRRGATFVLRLPYHVDAIGAEGSRAVVGPLDADGSDWPGEEMPPIVVWHPGRGRPERLLGSLCGTVQQPVLAGDRLTLVCDHEFLDESYPWVLGFDLRTRLARALFLGYGFSPAGGHYLNGLAGGGGFVVYETELAGKGERTLRRTIWRASGPSSQVVKTGRRVGLLVAADRHRLALQLPNGQVTLLSPNGGAARVRPIPPERHLSLRAKSLSRYLLDGRRLLHLGGGRLDAWDTRTGRHLFERTAPADAQLQAADGNLIVYTAGPTLHILSGTSHRVIRTAAVALSRLRQYDEVLVQAALTAAGLFYAYDVRDAHDPGRVVFVPRNELGR